MPRHLSLPVFSLFPPPYAAFLPVDPTEGFASRQEVLRGVALLWYMEQGHGTEELAWAATRPPGVPLMVILPPSAVVRRLKNRVLEIVEEARPQSILPYHPVPDPEEMCHLLRREPEGLAGELVDFLHLARTSTGSGDTEDRASRRRPVGGGSNPDGARPGRLSVAPGSGKTIQGSRPPGAVALAPVLQDLAHRHQAPELRRAPPRGRSVPRVSRRLHPEQSDGPPGGHTPIARP